MAFEVLGGDSNLGSQPAFLQHRPDGQGEDFGDAETGQPLRGDQCPVPSREFPDHAEQLAFFGLAKGSSSWHAPRWPGRLNAAASVTGSAAGLAMTAIISLFKSASIPLISFR